MASLLSTRCVEGSSVFADLDQKATHPPVGSRASTFSTFLEPYGLFWSFLEADLDQKAAHGRLEDQCPEHDALLPREEQDRERGALPRAHRLPAATQPSIRQQARDDVRECILVSGTACQAAHP